MNKNLMLRLISAFVYLLVIAVSFINQYTFLVVFEFLMLQSLWEFYSFSKGSSFFPKKWFGLIFSGALFLFVFLLRIEMIEVKWVYYLIALAFLSFSIELLRKGSAIKNLSMEFLGIFYIAIPFTLTNYIVFFHDDFNFLFLFGIFSVIWAYDVGAYFVGVSIGKRKIFASISPKKTLEGTIGGIVFGMIIGVAVYYVLNIFELVDWIIMALLISMAAFIGDLVESKIKRSVNVKDSGKIMPGHGGVLDRFDSFLFAVIAASLYSVFLT